MEPQKSRRMSKWLSKVFRREDSAGSQDSAPPNEPRLALSQASKTSPHKSSETSLPSYESIDSQLGRASLSKQETAIGEVSALPLEDSTTTPEQSIKHDRNSRISLEAPAEIQGSLNTPNILVAPTASTEKSQKSTSPYKKVEEAEKLPHLLDPNISLHNAQLWEKAYTELSEDSNSKELVKKYEAILNENAPQGLSKSSFPRQMEAAVQQQISAMKQKQWVLQWDQKSIVVRDQAERIVKFVQTFSNLGTAIAQIDPVHVGIPWAGVCAVLTLILNDSTQHQAALDGLEEVSSIVAKYIAIEDVYVQSCQNNSHSESNTSFEACIVKVYTNILLFQVKAALHFHRPTMARTVSNIVKSVDWSDLLSKIRKVDLECVAMTSMAGTANMVNGISVMNDSLADIQRKLDDIRDISKSLARLQDDWERTHTNNARVIKWISDIQIGEDHERVRNKLGSRYWDAGQWFLSNPDFRHWKRTLQGQLWLQGSVGTGKTSLASIVINELVKSNDEQSIAFYYCSRSAGAVSNNPTTIFRSLVAQLACTSDGEDIYPVIREWYKKDARRFVTGSRLSLTECEDLLVTLMNLRGNVVIIIDGIDECTEPMQLLRALNQIWSRFSQLKLFLTSRLDVAVSEILPSIPTIKSDFAKTTTDIRNYIEEELKREDRRNAKVITDELAERMVNILTQRAQGMFRWVELQLDLLISSERRIRYRRDFEDRLLQLERGSGQEVLDSLRETYDDIYQRNTQGPHSRRLAEKSLKWVLCAARPLKIWELGAAISVDGEDNVATDLIVDICSNFFMVDPRGYVQLAHLSVREYLEAKSVGGRFIFSPEEANAEAAYTCLLYWKKVSETTEELAEEDEDLNVAYEDTIMARKITSTGVERAPPSRKMKKIVHKIIMLRRNNPDSTRRVTWAENETKDYEVETPREENEEDRAKSASEVFKRSQREIANPGYQELGENMEEPNSRDKDISGPIPKKIEEDNTRVHIEEPSSGSSEDVAEETQAGPVITDVDSDDSSRNVNPPVLEDLKDKKNPYSGPWSDYFRIADYYDKTDISTSLRPDTAYKRFQRYASIYWATHCRGCKNFRQDENKPLYDVFWDFMTSDGTNPAYQRWAIALLNETKLASLPTINPAPMIFVPTTAHEQTLLDAEPMYTRWQETVTKTDEQAPIPLFPNVALISCCYGFTEILEEMDDEGESLTTQNHAGVPGFVLAANNMHEEILALPISRTDLNIRDTEGNTPLHYAAYFGSLPLARFLLGYPISGKEKARKRPGKKQRKSRVDVNAKDLNGRTALHSAAWIGDERLEFVKLLLEEDDLDIHARNAFGETAIMCCKQEKGNTMKELLRSDAKHKYSLGDEMLEHQEPEFRRYWNGEKY